MKSIDWQSTVRFFFFNLTSLKPLFKGIWMILITLNDIQSWKLAVELVGTYLQSMQQVLSLITPHIDNICHCLPGIGSARMVMPNWCPIQKWIHLTHDNNHNTLKATLSDVFCTKMLDPKVGLEIVDRWWDKCAKNWLLWWKVWLKVRQWSPSWLRYPCQNRYNKNIHSTNHQNHQKVNPIVPSVMLQWWPVLLNKLWRRW